VKEKNMSTMNNSDKKKSTLGDKEYPVQQFVIKGDKVTNEEVKESVEELNVDDNTSERG